MPDSYIDDYALSLGHDAAGTITGYAHLIGAEPGTKVTLDIPELNVTRTAQTDTSGRAVFSFTPSNLNRWSPQTPKLYKVELKTGADVLKDEIGSVQLKLKGTRSFSMASLPFCAGSASMPKLLTAPGVPGRTRMCKHSLSGLATSTVISCAWRIIRMMNG